VEDYSAEPYSVPRNSEYGGIACATNHDVLSHNTRSESHVSNEQGDHNRVTSRHQRPVMSSVKLGSYNGNTCLETFLAKFRNCARYFNWNLEDQLFHLQSSLEGAAGQILWSTGRHTTVDQLIRLLRNRFGNENQAERFRAELRCRRRRKGESLQTLYQDICRLMTLAYPGPSSDLSEIVGRDAFLDALGNQALRIRILEREPRTLDEALNLQATDSGLLPAD